MPFSAVITIWVARSNLSLRSALAKKGGNLFAFQRDRASAHPFAPRASVTLAAQKVEGCRIRMRMLKGEVHEGPHPGFEAFNRIFNRGIQVFVPAVEDLQRPLRTGSPVTQPCP